ncbi:MAG: hypothetical protein KF764_02920 [Labilithrix sp.]|nr:hypothetical protein [Labilithrix sp.]
MSNPQEKPTLELDQLAIIRGLLERQDAKVDALRAEAAQRGAEQSAYNSRMEAAQSTIRHEVKNLSGRVIDLTGRVGRLERSAGDTQERVGDVARRTSDADLAHDAAIGGAIAHIAHIDAMQDEQNAKIDALTKGVEGLVKTAEATNTKVEALKTAQVKSTEATVEAAEATNTKLDKNSSKTQWVAVVLAVLAAINAVAQVFLKLLQ